MSFPPNINYKTFSLTACIIGYILIDDFTANELNAIGNWLMLVGQILETSASQKQVIDERINKKTNINNHNFSQKEKNPHDDLNLIKNSIDKIQQELNRLINENN